MKRATALISVFLFFAVMAVGGHADNDDIDDAILSKDCYQTCWNTEHVTYAAFGGVCLIGYVPLAVYMRPKW